MKEKYYAGDRRLDPVMCYELCPGCSDPTSLDFAVELLERGNIRWQMTSGQNGRGVTVYVLYRDMEGLVLRKK